MGSEKQKAVITACQKAVESGEIKKALDLAEGCLPPKDLSMLRAQFSKLQSEYRNHTIEREKYDVNRTRIAKSLLESLQELEGRKMDTDSQDKSRRAPSGLVKLGILLLLLLLTTLIYWFFSNGVPSTAGQVVIGNDIYKTITVNGTTWLAEHLRLPIEGSSWCDPDFPCEGYGRLYTFDAARKACSQNPDWQVPSDQDWKQLLSAIGGYSDLSSNLVMGRPTTTLKNLKKLGFELKVGSYRANDLGFQPATAGFWSRTQNPNRSKEAFAYLINPEEGLRRGPQGKTLGFYCLCVKVRE